MEGIIESLVRFALNQRIVILICAIVLTVSGIYRLTHLPVDAFPDVTNTQVQIAAEAPGQSPEEVERFITTPLEIAMTGLPGLTEMRSTNRSALSQIVLVFNDHTDLYFARQMVLERLIEARSILPPGVTPVLGPISTGLGEIYQYTLQGPNDSASTLLPNDELMHRRTLQDWVLRPMLRSISGVADINSMGGLERQFQVEPDPDKLRHYQITLNEVTHALALNNANSGGGSLVHGEEKYLIRGIGLIQAVEDIGNIVLREFEGIPIHIHDIAKVSVGSATRYGALVKDGTTEAVGGIVLMLRGENARKVVKEVKKKIDEINLNQTLPDGLKIVPFYDRSFLVDGAISNVKKILIEAIFLVVLVLQIFLRDLRSSLVVTANLVLTPLCTFLILNELGMTANLMSLAGLAIAIGMVVDGSVVIVENAHLNLSTARAIDPTKKGRILLKSCLEVAKPVVFGVGIISLIFVPLMTLEGIEGKLFSPLAITIAIALFISLCLSLTLSPVLCAYLLKGNPHDGEKSSRFDAVLNTYLALLDQATIRPKIVFLIALGLLGAALLCLPLIGTSFMPEMREGSIVPTIARPPSLALAKSINLEFEAMRLIQSIPGVDTVVSQIGRSDIPTDPQPEFESSPIVKLKDRQEMPKGWDQDRIAEEIRSRLSVFPEIQLAMSQPIASRVAEMMAGIRSDVAIKIFGDDLNTLGKLAESVKRLLVETPGTADLRMERVRGQEYLNIKIDRAVIARYGINVSEINDLIGTAIGGRVSTEAFEGQRRVSVLVRYPEHFRGDIETIRDTLVSAEDGVLVRLGDLAQISVEDGPAQISREMGKRRLVIGANVRNRDLGSFVGEIQSRIAQELTLPEGYFIKWGGQFENLERAYKRLSIIIPSSILGIFILLFALFGSALHAGIILLVLPFASIGGIFGLLISGEYLSVPASVGFITLWGIAVLNGVVLVTYILDLSQTHQDKGLAIREACQRRFRPIVMTAAIAMLSLIPFLFSSGPGTEIQRPLAIVVIGGLITSTVLTLILIPAIYYWMASRKKRMAP